MSHRMRRREFLVKGSRVASGLCILPLAARAQGKQKSAKDNAASDSLIVDLERLIPKLMEATNTPGVSIAIIKDAKLYWRRGFGIKGRTSKKPVDNDTVFEAASMSKPVFAYAVMKLCEKGVIDLDTPLTKYTSKRFLEGDARLKLITARHVLSHTSGFQNWRSDEEPLKIHFTPGEKYFYSGEGYSYLQSVVTEVTGQSIETYMKANLFVPFGMNSSGYIWNDIFEQHAAQPHDPEGKPFDNHKRTAEVVARYAAAGDLHTTPTDYARFLIEVINPQKSDAFRLNKKSFQDMLRPQVKVSVNDEYSISWGLGWRIAHTKNGDFISHGGDNPGFHCLAEASIEKQSGFVIMTNAESGVGLLNKLAPIVSQRVHSLPSLKQ
jgi:CubicO group peptidase (beta-lactamase class C family)